MGFPLGALAALALRATTAILSGVPAVQAFATSMRTGSGADKKAAVLSLVQAELSAAELLVGRNLANDADVLDAAGAINDAVVAFHKLLGAKAAAGAGG
jgi:hypothetical protein